MRVSGVSEVSPGLVLANSGGKNMFVQSSGPSALDDLPPGMAGNADGFFTSVQAALASARTGRGDYIICLPGHVESIAAANAWSNLGTKTDITVQCVGDGTNRPTFTWTVAAASLLLSAANVRIRNARLFLAGPHSAGSALTVAAPITISATGNELTDCEIAWGFNATQIVGIGITTTAAATKLKFNRNDCYAETLAVPTTTFLRLTGTDFFECDGTRIIGPGSTTAIGPVQQLTTAALKVNVKNSLFSSTLAGSTIAFTAMAGSTGTMFLCGLGTLAAGNGITSGSGIQVMGTWSAVAGAAGVLATG